MKARTNWLIVGERNTLIFIYPPVYADRRIEFLELKWRMRNEYMIWSKQSNIFWRGFCSYIQLNAYLA